MKKVVIMGASSGIGYEVAKALCSRGVKVGLAARHVSKIEKLKKDYPEFVEYESIDITHKDAPKKLSHLIDKLGGMDIYFHVSGIGYDNPSLDPEREVEIVNTNCCGFARMLTAAFNYFRDNKRKGQIATLTSIGGVKGTGTGTMMAYSSSKKFDHAYLWALEQLARNEKLDITFTDIRPGWIKTPLMHDGVEYFMPMTLEQVVPEIIEAIVHKKRVKNINRKWGALATIWSLMPYRLWSRLNIPVCAPTPTAPDASAKPPKASEDEKSDENTQQPTIE